MIPSLTSFIHEAQRMLSTRKTGRTCSWSLVAFAAIALALAQPVETAAAEDGLPSWNEGATKTAIVDFVRRTTTDGSQEFVSVADRIAVFDNDGTLWSEQPMYVQLVFVIDRVHKLAPEHPEWKTEQPFRAVLEHDLKALAATGEHGLMQLIMATHAGMTTAEFKTIVEAWLATAEHPKYKRPYTECIYQPMVELLAYLRAHGFKTYIVSGGGIEFMRPWTEKTYGIPPEQVVGSSITLKYEVVEGRPELQRLPKVDFIDDGPGKPVGIERFIGRRPIAAFGNSDGDYEMLQWTTTGKGPRFGLIVHHTDAEREAAYDRTSHFGKLARALDDAPKFGWTVMDMKRDWKTIFPPK
ncbi:MAG: haloacid dehalogenase-like hydrolase [Planctomycetia bacterium]|nr:haloacid dehalogenase-like hydrolase [Planctomycetia bacterium]